MLLRSLTALLYLSIAFAPGLVRGDQGHADRDGGPAQSPAGAPGDPAKVSKVFKVRMLDSMRFEPSNFVVRSGQTVKFAVTNTGQIRHEFGVGTHDEQMAHAEMMLADPDMKHEDGSVITVEPGQTKALIWRFTRPGQYEVACQVPGHYPAGMMATIVVKRR